MVASTNPALKFKYQGQELEEELGKDTYAFQWRDYDPTIGRFNKIDRFAEKFQSFNPYHFSVNNPIFFREVKGDSINISELYKKDADGNFVNATQIEAFETFANTKEGKQYLSKFASKDQIIAGVEFDSDGEFHSEGIDLNFDSNVSGTGSGETGVGENNNGEADSNGRFQINISFSSGSGEFDAIETLTPAAARILSCGLTPNAVATQFESCPDGADMFSVG